MAKNSTTSQGKSSSDKKLAEKQQWLNIGTDWSKRCRAVISESTESLLDRVDAMKNPQHLSFTDLMLAKHAKEELIRRGTIKAPQEPGMSY